MVDLPVRILAGPENGTFITDALRLALTGHDVLTFNDRRPGLQFEYPKSNFEEILEQLPRDWEPDLVIWWLPEFQTLVPGIENCPYPTLLLISDWHVLSDPLLEIAGMFDAVGTDLVGLELLKDVPGIQTFHAPLYGFDPARHRPIPGLPTLYDVSHVGDLNPALHHNRIKALTIAAEGLGPQKVRFFQHIYGEEYAKLLDQSRITINYALRGEMSMRCYEAPACGSLLFCEDSNLETQAILEDRKHCVFYNFGNLVDLLNYYLTHHEERERIAQAGYERIQEFSYPKQGERMLTKVMSLLEGKRGERPFQKLTQHQRHRIWANYSVQLRSLDPPLTALHQSDLALAGDPDDSLMLNVKACANARAAEFAQDIETRDEHYETAIACFEKSLDLGLMVSLSLASALLRNFEPERALDVLKRASVSELEFQDVTFYPRLLAPMSVLWESDTDGRERTARWRLYEQLSELEPEHVIEHCLKALSYRSDVAITWFRLASHRALDSVDRERELEKACELDPSFLAARFALIACLRAQGKSDLANKAWQKASNFIECYPVPAHAAEELAALAADAPRPVAESEPTVDLESYLKAIRFRWLKPTHPIPPQVYELAGRGLEFSNTVFPEQDVETKQSLLKLQLVPRMSSIAIASVLNRAVALMPDSQLYVNVGVWHGYSFLAGLLNNSEKRCIGVDNFSQFGGPKEAFSRRFEALRSPNHEFHEMDYQDYFERVHKGPIGVYLYDGEHSYDNQFKGLTVAEPFFALGCIIVVDDTNWEGPRKATMDFVKSSQRDFELLLDAQTADTFHPTWWNGLMIYRCIN